MTFYHLLNGYNHKIKMSLEFPLFLHILNCARFKITKKRQVEEIKESNFAIKVESKESV